MKQAVKKRAIGVEPLMAGAQSLPGLDEATFQQMLEAAYVLQERQRTHLHAVERRAPGLSHALAEIAATQEVLHAKEWDLKTAARLIAEQLQKITTASGVAVALIREEQMEYCAAVGGVASLAGMSTAIDATLAEFLQTAASDPALIGGLLKRHSPKAPFLFPVFHEGRIAGLLDVRFGECEAITEQEVQSCQVMSGLMGQAIASAAKTEWKNALAAERASMLDVLEKLRPQLERLALEPEAAEVEAAAAAPSPAGERSVPEIEALLTAMSQAAEKDGSGANCGQCGYHFGERELFCGRCGTPRLMSATPEQFEFMDPSPRTSEVREAPAGEIPAREATAAGPQTVEAVAEVEADPDVMPEPAAESPVAQANDDANLFIAASMAEPAAVLPEAATEPAPPAEAPVEAALEVPAKSQPAAPWGSAAQALRWLKTMETANSPGRIWLARHRGDISIALSALVLLIALTGWGLQPAGAHKPRLTLFERMLVSLGVAEPPPPATAAGNPNLWVWVDVHTALYYCPGSELYGKTAGGKFLLQKEAQLDQFQPAERASCQ